MNVKFDISLSVAMYLRIYLICLYIQQYNGYVFDLHYPIVLTSGQDMPQFNGDTYKTDHFGFSLDLAKYSNSISLWVGAPKGASSSNSGSLSGSLHACNLNLANPLCEVRPAQLGGANDDNFNDQLFGITVNTVKSSRQGTEVTQQVENFAHIFIDYICHE